MARLIPLLFALFFALPLSARPALEITGSFLEGEGAGRRLLLFGKLQGGGERCRGSLQFFLPEGWRPLVEGSSTYLLDPEGEQLFFECFAVPPQTVCGGYPVMAAFLDEEGCFLAESCTLVEVPRREELFLTLSPPSIAACGQPFETELLIENRGNCAMPYTVSINEQEGWRLDAEEAREGTAHPGESVRKKVWITSLKREAHPRVLSVFLFRGGELIARREAVIDVVAKGGERVEMRRRLPAAAQFSAFGKENFFALAASLWSHAPLSSGSCRTYDLFLRLPTESDNVLYRQYQSFYLNFCGPSDSLTFGDALYDLSFLTEHCALRRGIEGRRRFGKIELCSFYWREAPPFSCRVREWGGAVTFEVSRCASLSWNFLHKERDLCPSRSIQSLLLRRFGKRHFWEAEAAWDHRNCRRLSQSGACHLKGEGSGDSFWYAFEKSYAGRYYDGYLNDLDLSAASGGVSVNRKMRFHLGGALLSEHLRLCLDEEEALFLKQRNLQGGVNVRAGKRGALTVQGLYLRSEDASSLPLFNFAQNWVNGTFLWSRSLTNWMVNLSYGNEHDLLRERRHKNLQRYGIYWSRSIGRSAFRLLFETGNTNYYDAKRWKTSYGIQGSWRFSPNFCLGALVRRSENFYKRKALNHVALWGRAATARGERWHGNFRYFDRAVFGKGRRFEFILSYSFPFRFTAGRRRDRGALYGELKERESGLPYSNALVSLGEERVLTDEEGRFWFEGLAPGTYAFNVRGLKNSLEAEEQSVEIAGGRDLHFQPAVSTAASLAVKVYLYEEGGDYSQWEARLLEGKKEPLLQLVKSTERFVFIMENRERNQRRRLETDCSGEAVATGLPPGEWSLAAASLGIYSGTHRLKEEPLQIALQPGGSYEVEIYLIPKD